MLLSVMLIILLEPFTSKACDKEITKFIEDQNMLQKGVMDYIKDKTFIDVFYGGKFWMKGLLSEELHCAWFQVNNKDQGKPEVLYNRKKMSRSWVKVTYETLRKLDPRTFVSEKLLIKEEDGIIIEENAKGNTKYYVYPLYINKEAGVYAYHRCTTSSNPVTSMWWTNIAVDNAKIGDPPMQFKDENTWPEVVKAYQTINRINKIKEQVSMTIRNPDRCVFDKKWPKLKIKENSETEGEGDFVDESEIQEEIKREGETVRKDETENKDESKTKK